MLKSLLICAATAFLATSPLHASTVSGMLTGTLTAPPSQVSPVVGDSTRAEYQSSFTNQTLWIDTFHSSDGNESEVGMRWGASWVWVPNGPNGGYGYFSSDDTSTLVLHTEKFDVPNNSDPVLLGKLKWTNRSNYLTGDAWSAVFDLNLAFSTMLPQGGFDAGLSIGVVNTPDTNSNPAQNEASGDTPDRVNGMSLNADFELPAQIGAGYSLEDVFLQLSNTGNCGNDTQSIGSTFGSGLWTNCEGNTSILDIYAKFSYEPVVANTPLPAGIWTLLAGLAGLAVFRRRAQ